MHCNFSFLPPSVCIARPCDLCCEQRKRRRDGFHTSAPIALDPLLHGCCIHWEIRVFVYLGVVHAVSLTDTELSCSPCAVTTSPFVRNGVGVVRHLDVSLLCCLDTPELNGLVRRSDVRRLKRIDPSPNPPSIVSLCHDTALCSNGR